MNSSGINNKRTCAIERESENSNICQYQVVDKYLNSQTLFPLTNGVGKKWSLSKNLRSGFKLSPTLLHESELNVSTSISCRDLVVIILGMITNPSKAKLGFDKQGWGNFLNFLMLGSRWNMGWWSRSPRIWKRAWILSLISPVLDVQYDVV